MRYIFIFLILFFTDGCVTHSNVAQKKTFYYHGIDFGNTLSPLLRSGIIDGCTTAEGKYQKSHTKFQQSMEYESGWFLGRNRCKKER